MNKLLLGAFVIITIASCGPTTQIVKTWKEPGATITASPENKTLVIGMIKDETSRRIVEDELVSRIKSKAVASYTLLSAQAISSASNEPLNNVLNEGKFTHVLMMLLTDVQDETYYVPGSTSVYYGGYGSYYGYGAAYYSDPGYYTTDHNYFVETTVYSVNPDKLLWTSTTKSVNPSKLQTAVDGVADVVTYQMKEDGFIPK